MAYTVTFSNSLAASNSGVTLATASKSGSATQSDTSARYFTGGTTISAGWAAINVGAVSTSDSVGYYLTVLNNDSSADVYLSNAASDTGTFDLLKYGSIAFQGFVPAATVVYAKASSGTAKIAVEAVQY